MMMIIMTSMMMNDDNRESSVWVFVMLQTQLTEPVLYKYALEYIHNRCTKSPPTGFVTPLVPASGILHSG